MHPLHRIVLTGGPCGGKSTALAKVSDRLSSLGFRVFLVPEAATMMFGGGATLRETTPEQLFTFQASLLRLQLALEESFLALARSAGQPAVLLYDRGALDPSAYVDDAMLQALVDDLGTTPVALRDGRYDAVLHLVTAAEGAEFFYSTTNNPTRTETPEQARAIDQRLREAWLGHPHLRVIDNSTDFEGKIRRVFEAVRQVTGIPEPVEIERKFLLTDAPQPFPVRAEVIYIEQTYLRTSDGTEARVRRRGQRGSFIYTHTVKKPLAAGQRVEVERPISAREYVALLAQSDPHRRTVRKQRTCFLWEGQYFELDRFIEPCSGLLLLEVELDHIDREISLPPFLTIDREVTSKSEFSNYTMAAHPKDP